MAVTTSRVNAAVNALTDLLAAREGLEGVQVASGHLGKDTKQESIQLQVVTEDQEWAALGNRLRMERMRIHGAVWVMRAGSNEKIIREVRARAFALLAEIEAQLRETPKLDGALGPTGVAELETIELDQGANDKGRWCELDFVVGAQFSRLPRT